MKRKNCFLQCLAMVLGTAVIFSAGGMKVKAQDNDVSGNEIVEGAGNSEMKAYGISLEEGGTPQVDAAVVPTGSGQSYYVDSVEGSDENAGTTMEEPWKSIEKINQTTFQPGDTIQLKAGSEWDGVTLSPKGSGTNESPIILSAYGEGELPKLIGHAEVSELLYLENQEYWDISNLEISNQADAFTGTEGELLQDVRGIRVAANPEMETKVLSGYNLHDLYIHDVSGEVRWIGGSGTVSPGVTKGGGWDGSKRTGGILFEVLAPEENEQPITFADITVEKNVLNNNSFGGIMIKQWKGDVRGTNELWANREKGSNWTPHTNIVIQDNYLSQKASSFACNTIYLTSIDGALVQRNVSREAGTCGIEMYYTDNTVVQHNEVYDTRVKAGGADSNAIDPDKCATNALIQYNYIHDTGDGILLCGFVEGSSVVRYNVIQDAEKRYLNPHGDKGENYIYNNIFYNSEGNADFVKTSGDDRYYNDVNNFYYLYNNIFYNAAGDSTSIALRDGDSIQFDNNCYYGANVSIPSNEKNAISADPQFINPDIEEAKNDVNVLANLKLTDTSPLLGMGRAVDLGANINVSVGDTDFFGNTLRTPATVGIAEYTGEKAIVKGYVTDEFDNKVSGAVVTLNNDVSATTDDRGYFQFVGLEEGSYEATVSKEEQYEDGSGVLQANMGEVSVQNLVIGSCTVTTGTVQGVVTSGNMPLADATVTVTGNDINQTAQTDQNGGYSLDVPAGTGYTVTASKEGYESATAENIEVKKLGTTAVELQLSAIAGPVVPTEYFINEDFSAYDRGAFTGNSIWGITDPGAANGSIQIEEENGNNYLHLAKTDKAGVIAFYNKESLGAADVVTIEAKVKRTDVGPSGAANQYGIYTFNSSDWNAEKPSESKNPMATAALAKGDIVTHNVSGSSKTTAVKQYQTDQWYTIRNVADLKSGTFDLYIDDMETPVLADQPLRTVKSTLDYINIFSSNSNYGDLCVDYIRVNKGDPYNYDDASLTDLSAEGVAITRNEDNFSAEVPAQTDQIAVMPVPGSAFAEVSINQLPWDKTNPVTVALAEGMNTIPIVVTAESGQQKEYSLEVNRGSLATVAYLNALSIEGVSLNPEFDKATTEYSAETDMNRIKLQFEKAAEGCTAKVKVNDANVDDPNEIALNSGENTIEVTVESQDGADNLTYTIRMTYKPNQEVNREKLNQLIAEAEKKLAEAQGVYAPKSIDVLKKAIMEAKETAGKADATQEEIDGQVIALQSAIDGLKAVEEIYKSFADYILKYHGSSAFKFFNVILQIIKWKFGWMV